MCLSSPNNIDYGKGLERVIDNCQSQKGEHQYPIQELRLLNGLILSSNELNMSNVIIDGDNQTCIQAIVD